MLRSHDYKHSNVMHKSSVRPLYIDCFYICIITTGSQTHAVIFFLIIEFTQL